MATILISAARFPKHFSASTHGFDSRSASSSQARASLSGRISANVPQTTSLRTNDQTSASQLLAQRAAHGDVAAQVDLAASYLEGENVPADPAKAASWYIIAGENGNAEAKRRSIAITRGMAPFEIAAIRFNLGKMYMNGVGVKQNYVSAYTWFELAKAAGDIRAEGQENTLEEKMSGDQVKQAKQRASQWLESHSRKSTSLAKR